MDIFYALGSIENWNKLITKSNIWKIIILNEPTLYILSQERAQRFLWNEVNRFLLIKRIENPFNLSKAHISIGPQHLNEFNLLIPIQTPWMSKLRLNRDFSFLFDTFSSDQNFWDYAPIFYRKLKNCKSTSEWNKLYNRVSDSVTYFDFEQI